MDRAPWHKSVVVPPNITILYLPPYSPELNPIEQVWDYLRSNYLSNRVYETLNDVFTACCEAWNLFAAQPEVIFSLGMRSWII
jgi:transposase